MILSGNTKETLSILIRKEFDSVDLKFDYIHRKADALIQCAFELGLKDLAIEMENDLKITIND